MKKIFIVFIVVNFSMFLCLAPYVMAEQNSAPPLLVQQPIAQPLPSRVAPEGPPPPRTPPGPPAAPPPLSSSIGQTIPIQTLLNNLSTAITTVQKISGKLTPGKVWTTKGPAGEIEIKAGILYQGSVVAVLHFNPVNGKVLPIGIHPRVYQNICQIQAIKEQLTTIVHELRILPAAEFREREASWAFPIVLGNTIVAHLKVYCDGIHIVPDYPANQEMRYYGQ